MTAISRPVYDSALNKALARSSARTAGGVVKASVQATIPELKKKHQHITQAVANDRTVNLVPYDSESKPRTVHALVDMCCCFISSVWAPRTYRLSLKTFIHEVLRRSRVQYPVFQVALCYIMQLKPVIEAHNAANTLPAGLSCGRRVFVAALQVASKYLQDRSYSVKSWAKISGLEVADLKTNELALLGALNWETHIPYEAYLRCCQRLRITIDNAQARIELLQQRQRLEQEDHELSQTNVYATPTASPNTLTLAVPDAVALSTPATNSEESPSVAVWNHLQ